MFMSGDTVRYVGDKLSLKKGETRGEVLAPISNEPGVYVVEFGVDAYVVPEAELTRYAASKQELEQAAKEPEVFQKKRRRNAEED